jgi:PAS domain S-box-containing protein
MIIDLDTGIQSDIFSEILNDCPTGILVTDISGIIKNANLKICEISGYGFEELAETDIDILTHHQHTENSLQYLVSNSFNYLKWQGFISVRKKCGDLIAQKIRMIHHSDNNYDEKQLIFYFDPSLIPVEENQNSEVLISLGKMAAYLSH